MTGERVAMMCFDNPFLAPTEGGKRSMASRIHALGKLDISLDVYLLNKRDEGIVDPSGLPQRPGLRFFQYRMRRSLPTLFLSKYPLSALKRTVGELSRDIRRREYDAVLFEGEHVALYRLRNHVSTKRAILYYHDIESSYRAELAQSTQRQPHRLLQTFEARKFHRMEDQLAAAFDCHLFISSSELEKMRARLNLAEAEYAPYAVDVIAPAIATGSESGRLLYVGDLRVESNYHSIDWFIRNVLPFIPEPPNRMQLRLVGSIDPDRRRELEALDPRVEVAGYVESLEAEYQDAACVVAPVLFGAGVKIKLLDALARGQVVIANSKACEGTRVHSGEHLLVADDPAEFAAMCGDVLNRRESYRSIAEQGLQYIRDFHSIESHASILKKAIEGAA